MDPRRDFGKPKTPPAVPHFVEPESTENYDPEDIVGIMKMRERRETPHRFKRVEEKLDAIDKWRDGHDVKFDALVAESGLTSKRVEGISSKLETWFEMRNDDRPTETLEKLVQKTTETTAAITTRILDREEKTSAFHRTVTLSTLKLIGIALTSGGGFVGLYALIRHWFVK